MDPISAQKMESWRLFLATHAAVLDALARELKDEQGLPLSWYEVLLHLYQAEGEGLRMHELADSLLVSRSATTRFIDRMERAGLVERQACREDGRGTWVRLTEKGTAVFREAAPVHVRGIAEHFAAHLTDSEASDLARSLQRVLDAAPDRPARPPT